MGWKLYYIARRNLRTSRIENEYGVKWRGWLCAGEVRAAVLGEGCIPNTCSQGQGLGFNPVFSGSFLAEAAQELVCWESPVHGATLHRAELLNTGSSALFPSLHLILRHMLGQHTASLQKLQENQYYLFLVDTVSNICHFLLQKREWRRWFIMLARSSGRNLGNTWENGIAKNINTCQPFKNINS